MWFTKLYSSQSEQYEAYANICGKFCQGRFSGIFFSDSVAFHGDFPLRLFVVKLCLLHGVLQKLGVGWERVVTDLTCSKHPADVQKKRIPGTRRQHKLSEVPGTLFLNATHFSNKSNAICTQLPSTSNSLQNTIRIHITTKEQTGVAGKVLNVGNRKIPEKS